VIFRQFCTADNDVSYLLADPVSRYAAVLDPNIEAERDYVDVIRRLDLRLVYAIETHAHESHVSAAPVLRAETGARLVTHRKVGMGGVDVYVDHGERLFLGEEWIGVMETPGHSPCSLSYVWRDRVFTGHTLLAGSAGPCHRADADAGRLFDSIVGRLFALPEDMLVYPGRVSGERCNSSIGHERVSNEDLQPQITRANFIRRKQSEAMVVGHDGGWPIRITSK
jgi:sulfur dioxygenase